MSTLRPRLSVVVRTLLLPRITGHSLRPPSNVVPVNVGSSVVQKTDLHRKEYGRLADQISLLSLALNSNFPTVDNLYFHGYTGSHASTGVDAKTSNKFNVPASEGVLPAVRLDDLVI